MAAYAQDLGAGDREAIIGRYDPRGSFSQGDGTNEFWTPDKVRSVYKNGWQAPGVFEFADLTYESLGSDAVVVVGVFRWTEAGEQQATTYSYTAILVRYDGRLRIRLEHESTKGSAS